MSGRFDVLDHPILFARPSRLGPSSEWAPHAPFGLLLVDLLRPASVVELGTTDGDAYGVLCQAVRELGLDARCRAVPGSRPDGGRLAGFRTHHDRRYGDFSQVIGEGCEAARVAFPDGTIDLLHVDGTHGCGDPVRHLDAWLPKLSARGVVLLHGTRVSEREGGLAELWESRRRRHSHWEQAAGRGLGLLAVGAPPDPLARLLAMVADDAEALRRVLAELGRRVAETAEALEAAAVARKLLDRSLGFVEQVDRERHELRTEVERLTGVVAQRDAELRVILNSRTFRYTRPIRTILARWSSR